ncbi:Fic family protein [Parashewanella spongiae]|uniref:Fic family protein n=1 Tax=Parashewanella spongiae TaxID=342950 RepID=A0A3A6TCJ3_9GAMM|nr:Fic family protein [Parashewanella spongiae]MCL1079957.1 Fic family protein [Parashewanella spongiae]RJY06013.1 Fic family protein [Parashewanella spongiae]
MNQVSEKLAHSLEQLKLLQGSGIIAVQSKMLERTDRERLIKHGFIKEVMRGWYIPSSPDKQQGDSTAWYTSFWGFCSAYLDERLEQNWCLSPEQSIQIHIGDKTVPSQLLVRSPKGRNKPTALLHNTSVFDIRSAMPEQAQLTVVDGLRVYSLAASLVHCAKATFAQKPIKMRTLLSMVTDASEVLSVLLDGGYVASAGRLAGAFRNIGRDLIADNILKGMDAADYKVKEVDPFEDKTPITFGRREVSPYVNRLRLLWQSMRADVIAHFPDAPDAKTNVQGYLAEVEDKFVTDAYHSLSIEGYRVTHELIEHVRSGNWNPEQSDGSRKHLDAMAAKGYWDAFQQVKLAVEQVLEGANPGEVFEAVHADWYLALFGPSVVAGIIKQSDLAGYRTDPVYIQKSRHTPPTKAAVRELMPALFDLLMEEEHPAVRVVLGHFIFVYIHPYFDGNGRMGRFIMNLMMAAGGYSWTVVPVERRYEYMQALEAASVEQNITPFTKFIASLL